MPRTRVLQRRRGVRTNVREPFAGEGGHSISTLQICPRPTNSISHAVGYLLIVAFASFSAGCKEAPKATARPPEPVKVARVVQKDVPIYAEWVGTTVGYVTAQIRARVSGYLISQNYKEGTVVKAGALLFQIDPRQYQNSVNQAKAQLRTAESQLDQAKAAVAQA